MINRKEGLTGSQGIGYDYLLGQDGLYVQARSPHLVARVKVARATVKGLTPLDRKVELLHHKIPGPIFDAALTWFRETPTMERFFIIAWNGSRYQVIVPPQNGDRAHLKYEVPHVPQTVAEFHSHGALGAFFSQTDNQDEQGFRIYGVVGKLDQPIPEYRLRIGIYGHFSELSWPEVFDGPQPRARNHLADQAEQHHPTPSQLPHLQEQQ